MQFNHLIKHNHGTSKDFKNILRITKVHYCTRIECDIFSRFYITQVFRPLRGNDNWLISFVSAPGFYIFGPHFSSIEINGNWLFGKDRFQHSNWFFSFREITIQLRWNTLFTCLFSLGEWLCRGTFYMVLAYSKVLSWSVGILNILHQLTFFFCCQLLLPEQCIVL